MLEEKGPPEVREGRSTVMLPKTTLGWWGVVLSATWPVVAFLFMSHALPWAVFDTWVAPAILTVLVDTAAVLVLVARFRADDRAVLIYVAMVFSVPVAAFATLMLIMEAVSPH